MIKYTEYKYHLAALFTVTVWGATFVSTKVLIANSLTPAEIFLLRFAMAYVCILPFARGRMWAANLRDELLVLRLSPRGDMLALSAAMLWMVYSLVIKRLGGRYPAIFITRKVFFYGLVTILPVFAFRPFGADWEVLSRPVVWGNLLFLGVVASMLCYVLWNAAMHRLGAVRTTNYIYFNPLVTIVAATLCIGERITLAALAGAALILYGMWRAERA